MSLVTHNKSWKIFQTNMEDLKKINFTFFYSSHHLCLCSFRFKSNLLSPGWAASTLCHILNSYCSATNESYHSCSEQKVIAAARDWSGPCKIFLWLSPLEVWLGWKHVATLLYLQSNHIIVRLAAVQPASLLTEIMDL